MAGEKRCYPLSHVLRRELEALKPGSFATANSWEAANEKEKRQEAYRIASGLKLSALALSGGGIRSACVALGVIQSLAEARLLRQFDYLSTVSGGGYIGSWLSAWLHWNKKAGGSAETVLLALTTRRGDPEEPEPIRHLRAYSSYLTPKLGLTSADTWTAVTLVVRNLVLNWLILIPAISLVVLSIKIAAVLLHSSVVVSSPITTILVALLLLTGAGWSLGYKLLRLYRPASADLNARTRPNAKQEQSHFLRWSVLPAIVAGIGFAWLANKGLTPATALAPSRLDLTLQSPWWWQAAAMAALGVIVFGVVITPLLLARYVKLNSGWDLVGWSFGAASTGVAIWLGVYLYTTLQTAAAMDLQLFLVVFGMPWFMLSMLMGQLAYVMARSYSPNGDFEREWLARAGGWFIIVALGWIILSGLVLLGSELAEQVWDHSKAWLAGLGDSARFRGSSLLCLGRAAAPRRAGRLPA